MGLDESRFGNVVTAIIEANELPDIGKVYAKVIREEARLNSSKSREVASQEAVGFVSRREGAMEDLATNRDTREANGYAARADNNESSFGNRARDRICSHCGKTGHENNNCWQLIDYLEWMNERRGRGSGRGGHGGSNGRGGGRGSATSSYGSGASDLTPKQWKDHCNHK